MNLRGTKVDRGRVGWAIAGSLIAAVVVSVVIGAVGAPAHTGFDWRLMAEAGTAFGTLALAGYTAWLASTTRSEVGLAIEEQRARDRPIVVASIDDIGELLIEPDISKRIPTLGVTLRNVGLAPALDIRLHASYRYRRSKEELIPVLGVDEPYQARISLSALALNPEDILLEEVTVAGDYTDRQQRPDRAAIVVLNRAGLRDEQRRGAEHVARRAWPMLMVLPPGPLTPTPDEQSVRFSIGFGNTGRATAQDVVVHVVDAEGRDYIGPVPVGDVQPDRPPVEGELTLPVPHPDLWARLTWQDGDGPGRERLDWNVTFPAADRPDDLVIY